MRYVAIDLGARQSQICVRHANGVVEWEGPHATHGLPAYLNDIPHSHVVLEACAEALKISDVAKQAGHQVSVVPSHLARTLGVGLRGLKTDKRDARVLSEVACRIALPKIHIRTPESRELKSRLKAREALINARTLLINNVRGWLRLQLIRLEAGTAATFPQRVRRACTELPDFISANLTVIETMHQQLLAARRALEEIVRQSELCQRLKSVPGVGSISALSFIAAVDDVRRFSSAHAVESFLGLTPGENSSGSRVRRTRITKAGTSLVRRALVQGCWTIRRMHAQEPVVRWAQQIELRRGKQIAVIALARKLVGIMYAIWRDGTWYEPHKATRMR